MKALPERVSVVMLPAPSCVNVRVVVVPVTTFETRFDAAG